MEIALIELTERTGTLNYKHFANYFTHIFIVFICLEQNLLFLKPSRILHFLDNRSWPEGSYELGSVRPSTLPTSSGSFLGIGSLVFFFETQHGVRAPCVLVRGRARFFEKNIFSQKWEK